jgi:hypothetical protein
MDERPIPDPAGEPAAEDPPADSHVSTAINFGATDKSPEHEEATVPTKTEPVEPVVDHGSGGDETQAESLLTGETQNEVAG